MRLPAAAPGYGGAVLNISAENCWSDRRYYSHSRPAPCRARSWAGSSLGLCEEHHVELVGES